MSAHHVRSLTPMLFVALVVSSAGAARTWYVDDDAPFDPGPLDPALSDPAEDGTATHPFDAIQEALDAAAAYDTVLVRDGVYLGEANKNLAFNGKDMTLRSESGPDTCVIDCDGYGRGFGFYYGETPAAVVEGFTVMRGGVYTGCGAWCVDSAPTIVNCRFIGAFGSNRGAGIHCERSSPTLRDCVISDNLASDYGAILVIDSSHIRMTNCRIERNSSNDGAMTVYWDCSASLENCTIIDNAGKYAGTAMFSIGAEISLRNCTIANSRGGLNGAWALRFDDSNVTMSNCILWGNSSSLGVQTGLLGTTTLAVSHSCMGDGEAGVYVGSASTLAWGAGNIDLDPRLVRSGSHLRSDSPCVNAGDPTGDYAGQSDIDAEPRVNGGRADIGADEFSDIDADGLPSWWEQRFYSSATAAAAGADDDGDALVNSQEYAQSRNPHRGPATLFVDPAGDDGWDGLAANWDGAHGPKATLSAVVAAAERFEGDTVVLAPGTYAGRLSRSLNLPAKQILFRSTRPDDPTVVAATVIDAEGQAGASDQRCGLYFSSGTSTACVVDGVTIRRGKAWIGAAIHAPEGASPVIRRSVLRESTAERGGAVYTRTGGVRFEQCRFELNHATRDGGGAWAGEWGTASFIDCRFSENTAVRHGGGAFLCEQTQSTFANCLFADNQAGEIGGALLFDQLYQPPWANAAVNCVFVNNAAVDGGAIGIRDAGVTLTNCTLTQNQASRGGGVCLFGRPGLRMANSILWGDTATSGAEIALRPAYDPASARVTYCNVAGGMAAIYQETGSLLNWGSGNLDAAPQFIDADGPDGDPTTWADNDYHLGAGSPMIDAGWNALLGSDPLDLDADGRLDEFLPHDFDGESRIVDDPATPDSGCGILAIVDLGAFERGAGGPRPCIGEITGDGSIGLSDLSLLLSNFGVSGECLPGDLDGDETVGLADLALLLSKFGGTCE